MKFVILKAVIAAAKGNLQRLGKLSSFKLNTVSLT